MQCLKCKQLSHWTCANNDPFHVCVLSLQWNYDLSCKDRKEGVASIVESFPSCGVHYNTLQFIFCFCEYVLLVIIMFWFEGYYNFVTKTLFWRIIINVFFMATCTTLPTYSRFSVFKVILWERYIVETNKIEV